MVRFPFILLLVTATLPCFAGTKEFPSQQFPSPCLCGAIDCRPHRGQYHQRCDLDGNSYMDRWLGHRHRECNVFGVRHRRKSNGSGTV